MWGECVVAERDKSQKFLSNFTGWFTGLLAHKKRRKICENSLLIKFLRIGKNRSYAVAISVIGEGVQGNCDSVGFGVPFVSCWLVVSVTR